MRVIGADGAQLGIIPTQEALRLAEEAELQLVEVNSSSNPPVCKIMDYGKFKYETAKRDRDSKRSKKTQELKEVKFRPKTHTHDFEFKTKHARRFIEDGHKVRLSIQFRGREVVHPETGKDVLERVCKSVEDVASVHQPARMEGKRMSMILAPKSRKDSGPTQPRPPAKERSAAKAEDPAGPASDKPASDKPASDKPAKGEGDSAPVAPKSPEAAPPQSTPEAAAAPEA